MLNAFENEDFRSNFDNKKRTRYSTMNHELLVYSSIALLLCKLHVKTFRNVTMSKKIVVS
jgi:hypothetical protein